MHSLYKRIRGDAAHFVKKALGQPDTFWYLNSFERSVCNKTWEDRARILSQAEAQLRDKMDIESDRAYNDSTDPVVKQGYTLKKQVEKEFRDKFSGIIQERILVQVPDARSSPAGYSLFTNMIEAFNFIGIPAQALGWDEEIGDALRQFQPTILMSGDHSSYLDRIDWKKVSDYRQKSKLLIGLTASLAEYGNTPLTGRLDWAKKHSIDFYYSYREQAYMKARREYKPFFDAGHTIFSIPFGANPLLHYPVPGMTRDLAYTFIASTNKNKAARYCSYLKPIVSKYPGLIDGPGWSHITDFAFNLHRDRYIYARTKIGINMHLQEQINWANETNERTYQLAACGVPQVTDHAGIFDTLFSPGAIFVADTPRQYRQYFEYIIHHPEAAQKRALVAQREVFEKYTTFHRAAEFVTMLTAHFQPKGVTTR